VNCSRRDLALLLPAFAATDVVAQQQGDKKGEKKGQSGPRPVLATKCYEFADLPVTTNPTTKATTRQVYNGVTTRGELVSMHMTGVEPGQPPHGPHQHENEELVIVREGTIDMEIGGKSGEFGHGQTTRVGPGSVVYIASNDVHGFHNAGTTPALVYIIAYGNRT